LKPIPKADVLKELPIRAWEWPRILVHVPLFPSLPYAPDVFYDFMAIAAQGPAILRGGYQRVDLAHETAAEKFMDTDFTHLLMLDADHKHPAHIIQQLARWVIQDPEKLFVGGLNFRRTPPYDPCAFMIEDEQAFAIYEWDQPLIKVDRIGGASNLIAREVFERIKKPWFYMHPEHANGINWASTDMAFCLNCLDAGIDIWCDTTTQSPHMTQAVVTEQTFRNYIDEHPDEYPVSEVIEE